MQLNGWRDDKYIDKNILKSEKIINEFKNNMVEPV
jgi:hypothetical protein